MSGKIRVRLAALGAVAVLAAVLVPALIAAGQTEEPVTAKVGVLRLRLGATDSFIFNTGSATQTQTITGRNNCSVTLGATPQLATLVAGGGNLGFVADGFGVQARGEGNGQPCGRFDAPDQTLTLTLGSALAGKKMAAAELDMEFKFNARVEFRLLDGTTPVATYTWPNDFTRAGGSDDGPDSGDLDNYRLQMRPGAPFDTIRMTAVNGSGSLEGGADGTQSCSQLGSTECPHALIDPTGAFGSDSLFEIVEVFDGSLTCGDTVRVGSENLGYWGDFLVRSIDGQTEDCDTKAYNADAANRQILFQPASASDLDAVYTARLTFTNEAIVTNADGSTKLLLEYDPAGGTNFKPVKACTGAPDFSSAGDITNIGSIMPAGETWCYYAASLTVTGNAVGTEVWDVAGNDDPRFK